MTTDGGARATPWPAMPERSEGDTGTAARSRPAADTGPLIATLRALRASLGEVRLDLPLHDADGAARSTFEMAYQIDDYLLPRLFAPATPPLLVIGGSTGGGKSTLLNSLVGAAVSPAGVLRPTTRSPVLVCHPDDFGGFVAGGPLPGLPRSSDGTLGTLRVLGSAAVPAGLAVVDAPDVDSVEVTNRRLADRLLASADLWIFVTTAARYADAVPWELLRSAVARGASIAIVLSRVNHLAHATVSTHLRELLRAESLGAAPLFVIEQSTLDDQGLLPEPAIRGLRSWIARVAASPTQRTTIVRQTFGGALAALPDRLDAIADATRDQREAVRTLRADVSDVFRAADARLRAAVESGVLFQGDVVGHWQEYAGKGGLVAILQTRAGTKTGVLAGATSIRAARVRAGLVGGVVRLFSAAADEAAAAVVAAWQKRPGGAAAAGGGRALDQASTEAAKNAEDAAGSWLDNVDASVARADGTVRAAAMPVLVAAALQEGTLPVGREVDVAGGTVTLSAELLADVFSDDAVRAAGRQARTDLLWRLAAALASEERRFTARLDELEPAADLADRLRDAGRELDRRRGVVTALFPYPVAAPLALTAPPAAPTSPPNPESAATVEPVTTDAATPAEESASESSGIGGRDAVPGPAGDTAPSNGGGSADSASAGAREERR